MSLLNIYRQKKVLITGDTGFKGSWLAIWLKELGAEVFGYALPPESEEDNFVICGLADKIAHRDGDIRDVAKLKAYFEEVKPEFAFHLAAQPLVLQSYREPHYTFETNVMGTVNFFEAVRHTSSVKAAVNVTTDKCYDNKEWVWGYRENDAMGGKDPYSASKGCSELVTSAYMESFFMKNDSCPVSSARAGNVIGGGDWALDRVIPDYFRAVKKNEQLFIRNPESTRPWQHVLEPLSGYLHLAARMYTEGKKFSGGWNFGPDDSANYSVQNLIDKMIGIGGPGSYAISSDQQKKHEANMLKLDISKAVNVLGWKPALNFEETIRFTLQGYLDDLNKSEIYEKRVTQIVNYTEQATKRQVGWTI
jgi:CDP-glucose 4,6-dehydratase